LAVLNGFARRALLRQTTFMAARTRLLAAVISGGLALVSARGDWARWLGPTRDARIPSGDYVPARLAGEYAPVWKIAVRGGFSSPVVSAGKLVYLDEDGTNEVAHLVDAGSGSEVWRAGYGPLFQDEWGPGPRATPIIDGDLVFVQSCRGEFRCLALKDGSTLWRKNFLEDFGSPWVGSQGSDGAASRRGYNGNGIVDGEEIIVPVGSRAGACLVCFNKRTGAVVWKSQNDEVAYSSLQIAVFGGVKQVVALTADSLLGVRRDTGELLWGAPEATGAKRHAATPVIFGDKIVINSHTLGMVCSKISASGGKFEVSRAWVNKDLKINLATSVLVDGFLYNQGPRRDYVCVDPQTGAVKWTQPGFGDNFSATLVAGPNLLVLSDKGELVLLAADPAKCNQLGRLQICGKTWSFPAYTNGKLFIRDARSLACFNLRP
jgi:outer membrane protein assembly factor BamB